MLRWCSIGVTLIRNRAKSGSGAPGPENAPRGMKSITFANGFVEHFNVLKFSPEGRAMEPQRCLWLHSSRALLSQCIFHLMATKVSVAITLLLMYPYGSTTKCKENKISMATTSIHVVIIVPLWVDHKMQQDAVWGHVLG